MKSMPAAGFVVVGLLVVGCAMVVGCMQPVYSDVAAPTTTVDSDSKPGSADITLAIGDEKKFADMLAAHKGQVVFVDYWATWCESCVEFFPHTVLTHNKYHDQGLATIAVSFDSLEDEPKVREFLAKEHADFENLLSSYDDVSQEVATAFEFDVLPQFRLYDRTGKMRYEWKEKPADLEQRIEELLAEKAPSTTDN